MIRIRSPRGTAWANGNSSDAPGERSAGSGAASDRGRCTGEIGVDEERSSCGGWRGASRTARADPRCRRADHLAQRHLEVGVRGVGRIQRSTETRCRWRRPSFQRRADPAQRPCRRDLPPVVGRVRASRCCRRVGEVGGRRGRGVRLVAALARVTGTLPGRRAAEPAAGVRNHAVGFACGTGQTRRSARSVGSGEPDGSPAAAPLEADPDVGLGAVRRERLAAGQAGVVDAGRQRQAR